MISRVRHGKGQALVECVGTLIPLGFLLTLVFQVFRMEWVRLECMARVFEVTDASRRGQKVKSEGTFNVQLEELPDRFRGSARCGKRGGWGGEMEEVLELPKLEGARWE